jgi:hypothetical protein
VPLFNPNNWLKFHFRAIFLIFNKINLYISSN